MSQLDDATVLRFLAHVYARPPEPCIRMPTPTSEGLVAMFWYAEGRGWLRAAEGLRADQLLRRAWWVVQCDDGDCRLRHLFVLTEVGYREVRGWRSQHARR